MRVYHVSDYSDKQSFKSYTNPLLPEFETRTINAFSIAKPRLNIIADEVDITMLPAIKIACKKKNRVWGEERLAPKVFICNGFGMIRAYCYSFLHSNMGFDADISNHVVASITQNAKTFKEYEQYNPKTLPPVRALSSPLEGFGEGEYGLAMYLETFAKSAKREFFDNKKVAAEMKRLKQLQDEAKAKAQKDAAILRHNQA